MAVAAETPAEEPSTSERVVRVKLVCSHCDRVFVRHSRRGYTAKCPGCGTVNAGPALLAEQSKPKDEGARRRVRRRGARAEQKAAAAATAPPAAAPVRRKRTPAPAPESSTTPGPAAAPAAAGPTPTPAPGPHRRGLLERFMYGEGDDGGG